MSVERTSGSWRPRSSDLMAALAHIESNFPVARWKAGGLPVWPLLRLRWMFAEWARLYTALPSSVGAAGGRAAQLLRGPAAVRRMERADPEARTSEYAAADIVFLSDGISFSQLDGRWVERFCDPLRLRAERRGLRCTLWTPGARPVHPRYGPSLPVQPAIDRANVAGALLARLGTGRNELPAHHEVLKWLASQGLGTTSLAATGIRSDASRVRAIARMHERQLRRSRARLAFMVGYYSVEGMGFVLACRACGVPVVDIQHGVQGDLHPAYGGWQLPTDGRMHPLLPDRFWVWSDWERQVVARWADGTGHAALAGGNPWLDVWSNDGQDWPGAAAAGAAARRLRNQAGERPVILVTLQYGLVDSDQLDPLVDLLRAVDARFVFWVRLHPLMLDRREAVRARLAAAGGTVELDACTDLPLHTVLPHADVHLTHSSSTAIEAAQFGLRTVLTSAYGAELFTPLVDAGSVVIETGPTAVLASTLWRLATERGAASADARCDPDAALARLLAETGLDKEGR